MKQILHTPVTRRLSALAVAVALAACGGNDDAHSAPTTDVTEWNRFASELVAADQLPPVQVRAMAMVQIAVHDALNAIEPRYAAYQYNGTAPGASIPAAVAAATRDTLVQLLPASATTIEAAYANKLTSIAAGPSKDAGIAIGQAAAARKGLADNAADEWQAARTLALLGMAMFGVTVAAQVVNVLQPRAGS